jgi:D-aminopeptidase
VVPRAVDADKLDVIFSPYASSDRPGLAVGVALAGVPVYRRGFGLASVELPMVLTPSMRMRIGSATKQFCALAVMLLAEERRLSADDSIRRHVPELPKWAEAITLRQLMAHTSGMRCSLDMLFFLQGATGQPVPDDAQMHLLASCDSVNFEPDADFTYCNGGYVLLTEVVQRVTGQRFAEVLQKRILEPVGMYDSLLRPLDTDCLPNSATLHLAKSDGSFQKGMSGPSIGGEGGLVSTIDDMLRWLAHMSRPIVGKPETWAQMMQPSRLRSGDLTGYGLGLMRTTYRGLRLVHHSGTVFGGACQMLKVIDHGLDIVLLTNRNGIDQIALAEAVLDASFDGLGPKPVRAKAQAIPKGTFHAPGRLLEVQHVDGEVRVQTDGQALAAYQVPTQGNDAWFRGNLASGTVLRATGDMSRLTLIEFGCETELIRVEAEAEDDFPRLFGEFRVPSIGVLATLRPEADLRILEFQGRYGRMKYELHDVGPGIWTCHHRHPTLPRVALLERTQDGLAFSTFRTDRLTMLRTAAS